ncbi:hypothetical protein AB2B41_05045 [Marimonas sp. MJW-29]|uniref:Cellulose-binding protein n=1 Tax=Sulfitobacter sediminis TaxID=3234186 RepID=A0ABV3RJB3_9RHOB
MSGLGAVFSVLMVGHSLFGTTGPTMLEQALQAGTAGARVEAQIINGAPLKYNWENSASAQGVDARAVLPRGGVTDLILTEAIPLANHVQWSQSGDYARAFAELAEAGNAETRIFVQETWHSLKSGTGAAIEYDAQAHIPWRERLDLDLPVWEGIVAEAARGLEAEVRLIPAGQAMALLHDRVAADRIAGLADISALFDDDIHLNDTGHYFVAMVQYAALNGESPVGLPRAFKDRYGKPFDTPDAALAQALQQVAWEAVQTYTASSANVTQVPQPTLAETAPIAPRAPPATPIPDRTEQPEGAVEGTNAVAIGLAAVTDWSTQVPFLDLMKTARPWIGHRPGQWGGMEVGELREGGFLDAEGWPVEMPRSLGSIGTVILTDMPEQAVSLAGRYILRYEGKGIVEVLGRATNLRYAANQVSFDYTPGPGSVEIRIQRINRTDPPRNITVVKEDHLRLFYGGARFNPAWTDRIAGFDALRFMDWMETNNSHLSDWADRPETADVTYAGGVPLEVMIDLANTVESDVWFNIPHLATDDFVRRFAEMVRDRLDPQLTVYVEFSNEVWNWQFEQARWADTRAQARWGQADKWMQFYGLRAAEVARIWSDVFAGAPEGRLINVISSQTGWLGLETEVLEAPLAVAEGLPAPANAFDAYAITGYFGGVLGLEENASMVKGWIAESATAAEARAKDEGLSGDAADDFVKKHRYDLANALAGRELTDGAISGKVADTLADLIGRVWPHHAAVARANGLDLIMYEGGSHATGIGPMVEDGQITEFLQQFNYSAEMGVLYETLLQGWKAVGGQLFNAYSDVYAPTKWGSWGALRHLDDTNPRWDALVAFR